MMNRRIGATDVSDSNNHNNHHTKMERQEERGKEDRQVCSKGLFSTAETSEAIRQVKIFKETLPYLWKTIMSKHIETRQKLKGIADISSFTTLINSSTLSDNDKKILYLHYIDEKDFRFIGDMLGYSESTIKRRHKKALIKISKLL